jgi:hypothetical protein
MFERRTSVIGGNQNYARVLLDECRRLGVEVRVVVPAPDQMTDLIGEDERVHFLSPNRGQPGSAAVQFLRLSRFLRSLGKGWTFTCNNRISGLVGLPACRTSGRVEGHVVCHGNQPFDLDRYRPGRPVPPALMHCTPGL